MNERYDIKPDYITGKWIVIDTRNNNCPTGHEFTERLDALRQAEKMDKHGNRRP